MKKALNFGFAVAALGLAVVGPAMAIETGPVVNVPEPVTLALMGSGLVGMAVAAARRRIGPRGPRGRN